MSKPTIIKIIIAVLFALAIALGIVQRSRAPELQPRSQAQPGAQVASSDKNLSDYYQESQQLASNNNQPTTQSVSFLAGGDIMLSRNVATAIQKSGDNEYPFRKMDEVLKSTDFNFANFENPIAPSANKQVIGGHSLIFGAPENYIAGLVDYNFKIVNLANNHAFDQGLAGLDKTTETFRKNNIQTTGANPTPANVWEPGVVNAKGLKICFIGASYSSVNDGGKTKNDYVARIDEDPLHVKNAIAYAKVQCDFTVVTMHAGIEYTRTPNQAQKNFAHEAINDGADIVIGAHPHWVQTIEKYNGKYIFYSLGNFIFDQNFSQDTMEGLTLKIQISTTKSQNSQLPNAATLTDLQGPRQLAQLDSIELLPIIIENSQPRLATETETKKILDKIGEKENILKP